MCNRTPDASEPPGEPLSDRLKLRVLGLLQLERELRVIKDLLRAGHRIRLLLQVGTNMRTIFFNQIPFGRE